MKKYQILAIFLLATAGLVYCLQKWFIDPSNLVQGGHLSNDGQTVTSQQDFRKISNIVIDQDSDGVDVLLGKDFENSNSDAEQLIEKGNLVLQPFLNEMSDIDRAVYEADLKAWGDSDQPVRFGDIGLSVGEYFQQDAYDPIWSKETENSFYAIFDDPVFLEKFPTHSVYENQCKRTICKVSFNNHTFNPEFIAYFTLAPNAERFRKITMESDGIGGMHMYVLRGEH